MPTRILSDEQIEQFLTRGHVVLRECFPREVAQEWVARGFTRLGYDLENPATWAEKRIHMPTVQFANVQEFAPQVFQAMGELVGGIERIEAPRWGDGFICNLGIGADRAWDAPSPQVKGWHKDGDFFRHFLNSPEQGLLVIVLWTDIEPQGGGTFVACDSIPFVARFLAARPEGVLPNGFDFQELVSECHDFIEVTGRAGDVVLIHPFVLHSASQNHRSTARLITNPPIHLREPMNFNRENAADFSLVERAILRGLGVERLDFVPQSSRERIVPERVRRQQKMLEEEKARLSAVGIENASRA